MGAAPKLVSEETPSSTEPQGPAYLPDEGQLGKVWTGILVGVPTATLIGFAVVYYALSGTGGESHALVLALPFGGLFGFLGGGIGGLMATMKH